MARFPVSHPPATRSWSLFLSESSPGQFLGGPKKNSNIIVLNATQPTAGSELRNTRLLSVPGTQDNRLLPSQHSGLQITGLQLTGVHDDTSQNVVIYF